MSPWVIVIPGLLCGVIVAVGAYLTRHALVARIESDTEWIRSTAMRFSPERVNARAWCMLYYAGFLALLMLFLWIAWPSPIFAVPLWLLTLYAPRVIIELLWRSRRKKIDLQLPPTIATMANSIKAGLTLVQALERLAEQAPEPIRTEFKTMANQYAYGSDLETVVREAKRRLDLPNFTLFASALLLNREMGGDVAQTLFRISASLDKLHQMRKTVEAHTSEGRTNIKVLLLAPFFMLALIATVDPDGVKDVFRTSQGYFILLIAGSLAGFGTWLAARITRSEI
jgi:tight adherence protein B